MRIPENEIDIQFSRSSGAGGQNVNKVSSRVQARWNIGHSKAFNIAEKVRIRNQLKNRVNSNDEVVISAAEDRSQLRNREIAIKRLQNIVKDSLVLQKRRIPTKPTFASRLSRLADKRRMSFLKKARKLVE